MLVSEKTRISVSNNVSPNQFLEYDLDVFLEEKDACADCALKSIKGTGGKHGPSCSESNHSIF